MKQNSGCFIDTIQSISAYLVLANDVQLLNKVMEDILTWNL